MKRIMLKTINHKLLFFIFLFFVIASPRADAGTIVKSPAYLGLTNGLVGCWNFDGTYTKARDCSGNSNNGVLNNGASRASGKIGQGISFDGIDDYIDMEDGITESALNVTGDLTVSTWIYPRSYGQNSRGRIMERNNGAGYAFFIIDSPGVLPNGLVFSINAHDTSIPDVIYPNKWYHVVGEYSSSTNLATIYVNGVVVGTADPGSGTPNSVATSLIIGNRAANDRTFDGVIDEFRVYNRALSANEVSRLYRIGLGSTVNRSKTTSSLDNGLVGYWTFDEADTGSSGTIAKDRSGNNLSGTITGARQGIGKVGQALVFNNDDVTINGSNGVADNLPNMSVSSWFKTTFAGDSIIVNKANNSVAPGWKFMMTNYGAGEGGIQWLVDDADTVHCISKVTQSGGYNNNSWHQAVATFAGRTSVAIYIDGVQQSLIDGACATPPITDYSNAANIMIGEAGNGISWIGSIDDVRIYNRALSASEIRNLYQETQSKFNSSKTDSLTKGLLGYWTFDEADTGSSGTIAKDRSGNNFNGGITPNRQGVGKIGQALNFNGIDDGISGSTITAPSGPTYSISLWMKAGAQPSGKGFLVVWDQSLLQIYGGCGDGSPVLFFTTDNGCDGPRKAGLIDNNWHHIVVTVNGATTSLYTDGQFVQSATDTIDVPSGTFSFGNFFAADYYKGLLDDLRLYNRVLSGSEVNKLYQMGK